MFISAERWHPVSNRLRDFAHPSNQFKFQHTVRFCTLSLHHLRYLSSPHVLFLIRRHRGSPPLFLLFFSSVSLLFSLPLTSSSAQQSTLTILLTFRAYLPFKLPTLSYTFLTPLDHVCSRLFYSSISTLLSFVVIMSFLCVTLSVYFLHLA